MKRRIVSSIVLAGGLMCLGVMSASAHTYCSVDPTYRIGLPVKYSLNVNVSTQVVSADFYASGTRKTTTFGGGVGIG